METIYYNNGSNNIFKWVEDMPNWTYLTCSAIGGIFFKLVKKHMIMMEK